MTGKDMLQGIQNLDAELIEESEFGTFGRGKARGFGKKKLLLILAAALIMATMTAAAAITRWTATMQYGDNGGTTQQISEQVKKQAEQSGLSATPTETKDGKKKAVSATDNGITVTKNTDGTFSAALPNETKTYTFTASYDGDANHEKASDTCVVSVTYKGSSHHSSSTSNTVSASTASNGKVSLDKSTVKKGDTVTVTVTPDAGY